MKTLAHRGNGMGSGPSSRPPPISGIDDTAIKETKPRSYAPSRSRTDEADAQGARCLPPSASSLQEVIDALPEQIALLDTSWTILAVNRAWSQAIRQSEVGPLTPGSNYLDACERCAAGGHKGAAMLVHALRQITVGTRKSFRHVDTKQDGLVTRHFQLTITAFHNGGDRLATIARNDVTELMALAQQSRATESSLINIQQEERRRIGRELHDATAQLLVVLHLNMIRLKGMYNEEASQLLFAEIDETLQKVNNEIRAISYLLHPPPLEAGGLVEALDAMSSGFGRRMGLQVSFWFEGENQGWSPAIEGTLYRLAQEALANVHRHAQANRVGIRLAAREGRYLHLLVEDDGCGVPPHALQSLAPLGVGIASMRSRVNDLGGRLSIRQMKVGSCIIASIPLRSHRRRGG